MTYYERPAQLLETLRSFAQYKDPFNVIIVDDNSPNDITLPHLSFDVTVVKLRSKICSNPCCAFNIGFSEALRTNPKRVIIQNAECAHHGDIMGYVRAHLTDSNYFSFAAYSLGKGEKRRALNQRAAVSNGDSGWYNHSKYAPKAFHFCAAITADNLRRLNGFDERFAGGIGYEDDFFIHQVRMLGLEIQIIDSPFVFHQYHYDIPSFHHDESLYQKTAQLCKELKTEQCYRAVHELTPDLQ